MVCEPVALRNTVGEILNPSPPSNVALFGVWAEASGGRNETPAITTSRKRNARVGRRGTPARVAESKQGGGYRAGGPRPAACFRAHAFAPAGFRAGRLMRPGIHFRRRFRRNLHSVLRITGMTKQIIITSRALCQPDPPPRISARTGRPYFQRSGKTVRLRQRSARKTGRKTPAVRGTRTPSRRRARTGNFMKSRARKEPLASGPPSPLRRPGPSADPDPRAGSFD